MNARPLLARPARWLWPVAVAAAALAVAACGGDDDGAQQLTGAAEQGRQLAEDRGCSNCHSANGDAGTGPTWKGIWGTTVRLDGGATATVDPEYVARSIRDPQAQVVEGFTVQMPSFDLSDQEIDELVTYLQALAPAGDDDPAGGLSSQGDD